MNAKENENICNSAEEALRWGGNYIQNFPGLIRKIIELEAWREREVQHEGVIKLNSLRELITEKPLKGWGTTIEKVQKYINDDPDLLVIFRESVTPGKGGDQKSKNINNNNIIIDNTKQGTSKAYTLDRLNRQAPELYEEVKAGNLSANAAAIKAGFRKKDTPLEVAIKAFGKLSNTERSQFIEAIGYKKTTP